MFVPLDAECLQRASSGRATEMPCGLAPAVVDFVDAQGDDRRGLHEDDRCAPPGPMPTGVNPCCARGACGNSCKTVEADKATVRSAERRTATRAALINLSSVRPNDGTGGHPCVGVIRCRRGTYARAAAQLGGSVFTLVAFGSGPNRLSPCPPSRHAKTKLTNGTSSHQPR